VAQLCSTGTMEIVLALVFAFPESRAAQRHEQRSSLLGPSARTLMLRDNLLFLDLLHGLFCSHKPAHVLAAKEPNSKVHSPLKNSCSHHQLFLQQCETAPR